jgi:hypothetical protein
MLVVGVDEGAVDIEDGSVEDGGVCSTRRPHLPQRMV